MQSGLTWGPVWAEPGGMEETVLLKGSPLELELGLAQGGV